MKIKLYEIPVASTDFLREACLNNCNEIRFVYRLEGRLIEGGIQFKKVSALRKHAERCCKLWHIENTFDTLVEIDNSEWSVEIRENTTPHLQGDQQYHHYMIYLDSVGCFEFIAGSWEAFERIIEETNEKKFC
jgi:hypothetical protein